MLARYTHPNMSLIHEIQLEYAVVSDNSRHEINTSMNSKGIGQTYCNINLFLHLPKNQERWTQRNQETGKPRNRTPNQETKKPGNRETRQPCFFRNWEENSSVKKETIHCYDLTLQLLELLERMFWQISVHELHFLKTLPGPPGWPRPGSGAYWQCVRIRQNLNRMFF